MSMTISFDRVGIYNEDIPSIKTTNLLITWPSKVTENILAVVSLLPQGLWPLNLARWWLTTKSFNPLSRKILWTCGHVKLRDKLKTFYLHYHNTFGHQTWQGGYLQGEASFHKSNNTLITCSSNFDFSYTICRFRAQMPMSSPTSCLLNRVDTLSFPLSNAPKVI